MRSTAGRGWIARFPPTRFSKEAKERNIYLEISVNLRRKATDHIKIAVVTALPKERAAVAVMLDEVEDWPFPGLTLLQCEIGKVRSLVNGRIHHVLLAQCPKMGNNSAAITATQLISDFPNVSEILMVGIAGAIPNLKTPARHVRLGDIIVSRGDGVVQYDFVKIESLDRPTVRSTAPPPSALLQGAVDRLEARRIRGEQPWEPLLERAQDLEDSARPPLKVMFYTSTAAKFITRMTQRGDEINRKFTMVLSDRRIHFLKMPWPGTGFAMNFKLSR
jgi:nucleoside phosphorylase